jgi:hypothetical protein
MSPASTLATSSIARSQAVHLSVGRIAAVERKESERDIE